MASKSSSISVRGWAVGSQVHPLDALHRLVGDEVARQRVHGLQRHIDQHQAALDGDLFEVVVPEPDLLNGAAQHLPREGVVRIFLPGSAVQQLFDQVLRLLVDLGLQPRLAGGLHPLVAAFEDVNRIDVAERPPPADDRFVIIVAAQHHIRCEWFGLYVVGVRAVAEDPRVDLLLRQLHARIVAIARCEGQPQCQVPGVEPLVSLLDVAEKPVEQALFLELGEYVFEHRAVVRTGVRRAFAEGVFQEAIEALVPVPAGLQFDPFHHVRQYAQGLGSLAGLCEFVGASVSRAKM